MKHFCILIFIFFGFAKFGYGQLSDLHYLPPLKQGSNNSAVKDQVIYLSTPETIAFTVNAYIGISATPSATFSISNLSPGVYNLPDGDNDITMVKNDNTGVVISNGGLRFESVGGQKFYVNYRGTSSAQATSLTSKGRQALGTKFKWGGAPNYATTSEITTALGIMATEDNTVVDITGYDPNCEFRLQNNRGGITSNTIQVTLNKNQSFVLEAYTNQTTANIDGWLGASIAATKNIAISNGGLNYGVVASSSGSRDAGIDQPVPENKLGKEYVFIRGNGRDDTEFPIIIGTQNNTEIFVNGATTPIATINNGDYFIVPGTNYSSSSAGANMLITTSKDAYAYQNLAGSSGVQTIGLNFVAPVNCLLPDNMDNIPDITNAAGTTLTGGITIIASTTTPNNNITVTDGSGTVTLPAPLSVAGSSDWKTFYLANLTGNVKVQSSGPIAVGFFGVNANRGIAGYFSGFDTVPEVGLEVSGGGCLPGSDIQITSGTYDSYQWYGDGTLIAGAIFSSYTPTIAGDYYVKVRKGTCTYDSQPLSAYYCDPDIVIKKTADKSEVLEGESVAFKITVESFGKNPVTNIVVTDVMPPGFTLVSASPTVGSWTNPNWSLGSLNAGELESITIVATANELPNNTESQTLTNTATHTQNQTDSNYTTDSPTASVKINKDSDLDGVIDSEDLDDDNDGIYDSNECSSTVTNLTQNSGVVATSNTVSYGGNPERAIDNNTNGAYFNNSVSHTSSTTANDWITIDLGSEQYIDELAIFNRTDCCSNRLSSSYVMTSSTPFPTNTDLTSAINNANFVYQLGDATGVVEFNIIVGAYARYVRVQKSGANPGGNALSIAELKVLQNFCDTDLDGIPNLLDLDSDGDGCSDANEAYNNSNADGGDDGQYGSGTPAVNADGTVIAASYSIPADTNTSSTYDFQEASTAPNINSQPVNQTVFIASNATFSATVTNANTYQWQVSSNGGSIFSNVSNGSEYSGTQTNNLTVLNPDLTKNGYLYRVYITNYSFICEATTSSNAVLSVKVRTVITNRKITHRVNKN